MRKYIALLITATMCVACGTKKMHTSSQYADSIRWERRTHQTDSLARKAVTDELLTHIGKTDILIEEVVYDTDKADSTGKAPVASRRRTTIRKQDTTAIATTSLEQATAISQATDTTTHQQGSRGKEEVEESRHPPEFPWTFTTMLVMALVVIIIIRLRK